jgi:hypothetical protein
LVMEGSPCVAGGEKPNKLGRRGRRKRQSQAGAWLGMSAYG